MVISEYKFDFFNLLDLFLSENKSISQQHAQCIHLLKSSLSEFKENIDFVRFDNTGLNKYIEFTKSCYNYNITESNIQNIISLLTAFSKWSTDKGYAECLSLEPLLNISKYKFSGRKKCETSSRYQVILFSGKGCFYLDFTKYDYNGNVVLFLSPYQNLEIIDLNECLEVYSMSFHGDFYCLEYHKKEVACNGLLFNNIYTMPHIEISQCLYEEILDIFSKIINELYNNSCTDSILKSYIQLIFAFCSREKITGANILHNHLNKEYIEMTSIQSLFDKYYLDNRDVTFYAEKMNLSSSAFSKKVKAYFGKSSTKLINDRVVLEAKKQLHLTTKKIKEISDHLNFQDEFYFSRYFKKHVGISPNKYRKFVGISIMAK